MTDDPDKALRDAERDMDATAREMEHEGDEVDADIAKSHQRADERRERQGEAAGDVADD